MSSLIPQKRYEEYAYVLDFRPQGESRVVSGMKGPTVQVIGEEYLTLLELLPILEADFETGEKLYIGKNDRTKVMRVLGKLAYEELSEAARMELPRVLERMVLHAEGRYIVYFNELQAVTPRLHALELIPGIGKTTMKQILDGREKAKFGSFQELTQRIGLKDPAKLLAKRIVEELSGGSRISLFVKR